MPIMQYVMPSRNKQLKKLLHFYWEVCPKYDDNGKLKQEMILVVCVFLAVSKWERSDSSPAMQSATIWPVSQIQPILSTNTSTATSKWIYPWCHPALPPENIQRRRTPRTSHPHLSVMSRASPLLRPQERCLRRLLHISRIWTPYTRCTWAHAHLSHCRNRFHV